MTVSNLNVQFRPQHTLTSTYHAQLSRCRGMLKSKKYTALAYVSRDKAYFGQFGIQVDIHYPAAKGNCISS